MVNVDYRYEREIHSQILKEPFYSKNKLRFSIINDVYAIPFISKQNSGGLYDQFGILIDETSTNKEYGIEKINLGQIDISQQVSKPVIYLGVYESCWGHFITDCLKKLWFLKTDDYKNFKDYDLVFLSQNTNKLGNNHLRLLELIGVDIKKIKIINAASKLDTVVVPDSSFYYDEKSIIHFTNEFRNLITDLKGKFINDEKSGYEKIYFSYSNYKKNYKKTFGEEKLDKFFSNQGFKVIHPENYSVDEQLDMLVNCKIFASTEGSTSHNSIFVNPQAKVLIIPRGPYFSGYQQTIDSMFDNEVYYIDSSLSALTPKNGPWSGPNYFYVSEELMRYFNLGDKEKGKYRKHNFRDMFYYFKYCMTHFHNRDYYIGNIYSEKFFHYFGENSKKLFPLFYFKSKVKSLIKK